MNQIECFVIAPTMYESEVAEIVDISLPLSIVTVISERIWSMILPLESVE